MRVREVASLDIPELAPYRTLKRPEEHWEQGIFVAEGEKVVRRLLDSSMRVHSLLMTHEWFSRMMLPQEFNADVYLAPKKLLETIVGFRLHQGIMAVASIPAHPPIDQLLSNPHRLVAMDGILNPENVGIIVRNASGFGFNAVIVIQGASHPYLRRAVRNSMGTVFRMPVYTFVDLNAQLQEIRDSFGTRLIAADPNGKTPISSADFSGNFCVIFGNESSGVSPALLQTCDQRVAIPMQNETDSLNVASASAIFLYEASR